MKIFFEQLRPFWKLKMWFVTKFSEIECFTNYSLFQIFSVKVILKPCLKIEMLNDHKAINELLENNVTLILLCGRLKPFATHMPEIFLNLKIFEISSGVSLIHDPKKTSQTITRILYLRKKKLTLFFLFQLAYFTSFYNFTESFYNFGGHKCML